MLNRILGRTKAKELTAEEIEQVAGAGCWSGWVNTRVCLQDNGFPEESTMCSEWANYTDWYSNC